MIIFIPYKFTNNIHDTYTDYYNDFKIGFKPNFFSI